MQLPIGFVLPLHVIFLALRCLCLALRCFEPRANCQIMNILLLASTYPIRGFSCAQIMICVSYQFFFSLIASACWQNKGLPAIRMHTNQRIIPNYNQESRASVRVFCPTRRHSVSGPTGRSFVPTIDDEVQLRLHTLLVHKTKTNPIY